MASNRDETVAVAPPPPPPPASPDRILFGSCSSQHYAQPLWPSVLSRNASAFLWTGDAVYADSFLPRERVWRRRRPLPATPEVLRELYDRQLREEGYRRLLEDTDAVILGAQDDHDYGANNGDATYPHKTASAVAFVRFLAAHRADTDLSVLARRAAAGAGLYAVKVLDFARPRGRQLLSDAEAGLEEGFRNGDGDSGGDNVTAAAAPLSDRSVAIFLLDVRSHKTPWSRHWRRRYQPDPTGDFLGAAQWAWLEGALRRSTAAVNLVVSGLQVHADRYYNGNAVEDWSRFPAAQHRLYQALLGAARPVVLVSGDVHMAELLRKDCRPARAEGPTRMLLEVTSSGMTHSWGTNICARPGLSLICQVPYFAWCFKMGMLWAHHSGAWTDLVFADRVEGHARRGYQYTLERNVGEFEFDWANRRLLVRVLGEALGPRQVLLSTSWDFDWLSGATAPDPTGRINASDYQSVYETMAPHGALQGDWICINYGGHPSPLLKLYGAFSPIFLSAFLACVPLLLPLIVACAIMRSHNRKTA